jgi:hypothetical protein
MCAVHSSSHVSSELCTYRCLHGRVFERSCGDVCHEVRNIVKTSQVTIVHVLVCNIHTMGLTTVLHNETGWRWSRSELLTLLTLNDGAPLSTPLRFPISETSNVFVFFILFHLVPRQGIQILFPIFHESPKTGWNSSNRKFIVVQSQTQTLLPLCSCSKIWVSG